MRWLREIINGMGVLDADARERRLKGGAEISDHGSKTGLLELKGRKLRGKKIGGRNRLFHIGLIGVLNVLYEGWMKVRVDHTNPVRVGIVVPSIVVDGVILEGLTVSVLLEVGKVGDTEIIVEGTLEALVVFEDTGFDIREG